jgi:hypothetical protein
MIRHPESFLKELWLIDGINDDRMAFVHMGGSWSFIWLQRRRNVP